MTTIHVPNPLSTHIDWDMIGKVLGIEIIQGHPSDFASIHDAPLDGSFDSLSPREMQARQVAALERIARSVDGLGATTLGGLLGKHDLNTGHGKHRDGLPLISFDADPFLVSALKAIVDVTSQGGEVLVLTKPNLVAAVNELLDHDRSSPSVDKSPEPSDVDGSVSAHSRVCSCKCRDWGKQS